MLDFGAWEGYNLLVRMGQKFGGSRSRYRAIKNRDLEQEIDVCILTYGNDKQTEMELRMLLLGP